MRTKRKSGSILGGILVVLIFGGAGLAILLGGIGEILECKRLQRGPTAPATITSVTPTTWTSGKRRTTYYGFDLRFTFDAQGKLVTGRRLGVEKFKSRSNSKRDAAMAIYGASTIHTAHFEPANPERAVLDPSISREMSVLPLAGAAAISLAIFISFLIRRHNFPDPALPVNTRYSGSLLLLEPRSGPFGSQALLVIVPTGIVVAVIAWSLMNSRQPSDVVMVLGAVAPPATSLLLSLFARRIFASPRGAIVIDPQACTLTVHRWLGPPEAPTPFERVVDARMIFQPSKHAAKPDAKGATFCLAIDRLDDEGETSLTEFRGFCFGRDDSIELEAWLREMLCLGPVEPPMATLVSSP